MSFVPPSSPQKSQPRSCPHTNESKTTKKGTPHTSTHVYTHTHIKTEKRCRCATSANNRRRRGEQHTHTHEEEHLERLLRLTRVFPVLSLSVSPSLSHSLRRTCSSGLPIPQRRCSLDRAGGTPYASDAFFVCFSFFGSFQARARSRVCDCVSVFGLVFHQHTHTRINALGFESK